LFLTLAVDGGKWSDSRLRCFADGKTAHSPIGQETGWAPTPLWTSWRNVISLTSDGNLRRTPRPSAELW
jgi:hypothetical protein